jgi:serine phosphatase RsbU (regulator of sigma subunit)/pSer/pThr/pTyr-binding forkhead associated (FHA) protein
MSTIRLRVEQASGDAFERECDGGSIVIGRAAPADLLISDNLVSRRHARLFEEGDEWLLEDLGARNGTMLNGQVVSGTPRRVAPGDVVRVGTTLLRVLAPPRPEVAPLGNGQVGSSIFRSAAALEERVTRSEAAGGDPLRQAARLRALNEFHRDLASAFSLPELLDLLLDRLFAVLRAEEGIVLLRQKDGALAPAASRRLAGATGSLLVSRRLTEEVVEKRTAALVFDVADDARFAGAESVVASGVRSILAAPVADTAGCLGMIALYSRAHVRRFGEEDLELLVSLASAAALRIRNVALSEEAALRRVLEHELALAHDIQLSMLPRGGPDRSEIDLAGWLAPARAVGGDLYDYALTDDALWFIVADAAGKGVGAALFMAMTRALFRAAIGREVTPASVLARVNAGLERGNDRQVFVTALVGCLALRTGALSWSSAGHQPPLVVKSDRSFAEVRGPRSAIALGLVEDASYEDAHEALAPGDLLLLYTDGATDAVNSEGRMFSFAGLDRTIRDAAGLAPHALVERIAADLRAFAGDTAQEDDITLLAIRYLGAQAPGGLPA